MSTTLTKYPLQAGFLCLTLGHKTIDRMRERHLQLDWGLAKKELRALNEKNLAAGKGIVVSVFKSSGRRWAIATDLDKKTGYLAPAADLLGDLA